MKDLIVAGQHIKLTKLPQSEEKGLWFSLLSTFDIYKFTFLNLDMLLLVARGENKYSPGQLIKIADRIKNTKGCESVFYFDSLPTFERDRLVRQGAFFIVGNKFAMLPSMLMNRLIGKKNFGKRLRPAAQYLLLYHLQYGAVDGKTFKQIEEIIPYKYATIANSVKQLEELGLVETAIDTERNKRLLITKENRELWEAAQSVLISPVAKVVYSPGIVPGVTGGISALSAYSMLAPERVPTKILSQSQFKTLQANGLTVYPTEDTQRIEVWNYPPISENGIADKLSLYLSLKNDNDPRVEKELELMMEKLW